ncbi:metallophosphoesterase [bacterium]|nr:metallophosphoesterase [bacterium]
MKRIPKCFLLSSLILLISFPTWAAYITQGPFLTWVTNESAYINFETNEACIAFVNYGPTTSYGETASDETAAVYHNIYLSGLSASTTYYYQTVVGSIPGERHEFITAPAVPRDFTFVAYGDTRTGHLIHGAICSYIVDVNPEFILNSGDIVEDGDDNGDWHDYFDIVVEDRVMAQEIPIFYGMGNHDDESPYFYNIMSLPNNNPDSIEAYGSFDWGPIHFVSINTEVPYNLGSAQHTWLQSDLAAAEGRYDFTIVFFHRPPYASGGHGSEIPVREEISPLLEAFGVDLAFCGHNHYYERTNPINGVTYIVTGGGGAPPVPLALWQDFTAHGECIYHYCVCNYNASTRELKIEMFNILNDKRDEVVLSSGLTIDEKVELFPQDFVLLKPYPNPFNEMVTIPFKVMKAKQNIEMNIVNSQGKIVESFDVSASPYNEGKLIWNPATNGEDLPSGLYLITVGNQMKKVAYLK